MRFHNNWDSESDAGWDWWVWFVVVWAVVIVLVIMLIGTPARAQEFTVTNHCPTVFVVTNKVPPTSAKPIEVPTPAPTAQWISYDGGRTWQLQPSAVQARPFVPGPDTIPATIAPHVVPPNTRFPGTMGTGRTTMFAPAVGYPGITSGNVCLPGRG